MLGAGAPDPIAPSPARGLESDEARRRLVRDGPNRLPSPPRKSFVGAVLSVAAQPMVLLLLSCTVLYAVLGSAGDSVVLGFSIVGVGVCALGAMVLLWPFLRAAFGLPRDVDAAVAIALLGVGGGWSMWRLVSTRGRARVAALAD